MRLQVGHLQARKRKLRIHHVKPGCKTRLVGTRLAAERLVGELARLDEALQAAPRMFQFTPALFYQQAYIVESLFLHVRERAFHRLRGTDLRTGFLPAQNRQVPLGLRAHRPLGLQNRQVLRVEFPVTEQGDCREPVGACGPDGILAALAFRSKLPEPRVLFAGKLLEFLHAVHHVRRFHRGRRRNARVRVQQARKRHSGKRLVTQSILVCILRLCKRDFGTQAFRLAYLAAFLEFLGAFQVAFEVLHRGFAHHGKFLGEAERKVLGRHVHQDGVLRHVEFRLAGSHVLLGRIVCRINLEAGEDGPHHGHAGIEEHVVLYLHAKVGIVYLIRRIGAVIFCSLLGKRIYLVAPHDTAADFVHPLVHHALGSRLVQPGRHRLLHGIVVGLRVRHVVCRKVRLRIRGGTGHLAQGPLEAAQVNRNRVVNLRDTRRKGNLRQEP